MWTFWRRKSPKFLLFGLALFLLTQLLGCVPNLARTNARVEEGFDFALSAGGSVSLPGEDQAGIDTDTHTWFFSELDFQYGVEFKNSSALAIQAKVPIGFTSSALDIYYQFEPIGRWYFGAGAEVGLAGGGYFCTSHYFTEKTYLTFTQRVLTRPFGEQGGAPKFMLNPQLAFGWAGSVDVNVFASYGYDFGRGTNVCLWCENDSDYRKQSFLTGLSLRL